MLGLLHLGPMMNKNVHEQQLKQWPITLSGGKCETNKVVALPETELKMVKNNKKLRRLP